LDVTADVVIYANNGKVMIFKKYLFCFFSLSVFVMCSWFLYNRITSTEPHCDIDSKAYLERGLLCATTGRFVTATSPEQPYYALGYAAIIGMLYKILWPSVSIIILFQLLLALLSCVLMMRCARLLFGVCARWLVPLFFATSIGYLVFVQFVLTEIALAFFLLLSFERLLSWILNSRKFNLATAALALGTSIIIKPAALYFSMLLIPLIAWVTGTLWQRMSRVILFALCFYLPVIGYMTYNYYAFGNFRVSTLDRVNLYYWFFPNVLAHLHHTTSAFERNELLAQSQGAHNFAAVENFFWQSLRDNPGAFVYIWCKNVFKTFVGLYTTNLKVLVAPSVYDGGVSFFSTSGNLITRITTYLAAGARKPWVVAVGIFESLWSIVRYFLVIIALCTLARRKEFLLVALCSAYIFYFSFITGHDGCARFRMMFEFLLIILAAGGASVMRKNFMQRKVMV
jgi:4-amino-4-deoxy-L-arabinose transferase-like glycosyltransferase